VPIAVLATVAALAVALAAALGFLLLRGGGSSDDYKDAFEEAGVDYVTALQEGRCGDAAAYNSGFAGSGDTCPQKNLHVRLAQCLDVDGPIRVDMIGEDRARVVFVKQGYVEMIRGQNTLFRAGFMVASC
jgi:hypothetical protein